ncbi:transposable element Tc1 transposase [Trichonephila clavipes]|nr:transposable element Tc1 transposase [Trichonephila clavipes]
MKTAGWLTSRVAVHVDRSECAVRNYWEQWTREGTHAWKIGSGATKKTTRREDRSIVRQALVDPTVTLSTIRADVGLAIVPQTTSSHLAEANLKSKRPFRLLPLTPENRQLCLNWCKARSIWNVTDCQKVVFSDESRFVWGTDDNSLRVWRRPGPFLNGLPGAIFQQDNARPHTARVSQDFLRHFQILPLPAGLLLRFVPCRARVGSGVIYVLVLARLPNGVSKPVNEPSTVYPCLKVHFLKARGSFRSYYLYGLNVIWKGESFLLAFKQKSEDSLYIPNFDKSIDNSNNIRLARISRAKRRKRVTRDMSTLKNSMLELAVKLDDNYNTGLIKSFMLA